MSDTALDSTAPPTIYEWQARLIEDAAKNLAFWVKTTRPDKLEWAPRADGEQSKARTIYDQIGECAMVNRRFAEILQGIDPGPMADHPGYASSEDAQRDIRESAEILAAVVARLDEGAWRREYRTARGAGTGEFFITLALNNMYYHGGQINQIQLLYGDAEFRFPEDAETTS